MANDLRAGIFYLKVNGTMHDAKGAFTYSLGLPKRETIVGADGPHGFKTTPQVPYIEGEITDARDLDLKKLCETVGATVTLELQNGKVIVLREAAYCGDGKVQTEEGNIVVRFEGKSAEEVR